MADGREAIASVPTQANENARWRADSLDFTPVAKSIADTLVLPAGYTAAVVHATGDSINPAPTTPATAVRRPTRAVSATTTTA